MPPFSAKQELSAHFRAPACARRLLIFSRHAIEEICRQQLHYFATRQRAFHISATPESIIFHLQVLPDMTMADIDAASMGSYRHAYIAA